MSDLLEQASSDEGDELIEEGTKADRGRSQPKAGAEKAARPLPPELAPRFGADRAPPPKRAFALRPYQQVLVDAAIERVGEGGRPGIVLPTGGGKTAVMAGLVEQLRARKLGPVLILQDRSALAVQNGPKIAEWLNLKAGQIGAGAQDWDGDVIMAMRQSAARAERLDRVATTDWAGVLIDECHRLGSGEYEAIVEALPKTAPVVGLSATMARADGRALAPLDCVVQGPTVERLIQMGFLTPFRFLVPQDAVSGRIRNGVAQLKTVAGEFSAADSARLLNTPEINSAVVKRTQEKFLQLPERRGQGLVAFCSTIEHAEDLVTAYREAGVDARAYHSRMPQSLRDETLAAFDAGQFPVMANPLALGEGFDCARVGAVLILRPCAHRSTFVQIVGRGLRVAHPDDYPDIKKDDCIVFDYAAAVLRHRSLYCAPQIAAREDGTPQDMTLEPTLKTCPTCETRLVRSTRVCPECAHEFTGREPEVDATEAHELVRITFEAMDGRDWWRVGQGLYLGAEPGCVALIADLRDGTFLVMGYVAAVAGVRASLAPQGRIVGAEPALLAADAFLSANAARRGVSRVLDRIAVRAQGYPAIDQEAADALITAKLAVRAMARRYGRAHAFELEPETYEEMTRGRPDEAV